MSDWSLARARQTYSIAHWGEGYFDIADDGGVSVQPNASTSISALPGNWRRARARVLVWRPVPNPS